MTRVALNLTYLVPGQTGGMEVVARELIPALQTALPSDWELIALVNENAAATEGPWTAIERITVPVDATNRIAWVRAELTQVPKLAKRAGADLLHSLGNTGPWWSSTPRSVTVNDLIYRVVAMGSPAKNKLTASFVEGSAKRARRVIVAAESTATDLGIHAKVPRERIDVVPYGISKPTVAATPEAQLRERHALGDRPFVLSPSARQPHKNLPRLLEAHARLAGPRPLLVLPGYATEYGSELDQLATQLGIAPDVRWLGWVTQADLEGLYASCQLLVFPSLYEGFGLPVLEAMQRGVPVACSNRGSLAEIAGEAALIFDPEDPAAIAAAITALLDDPTLRDDLIARGHAQAAGYTWAACAAGYAGSFQRTLGA